MEVLSREEARAQGLTWYFTGKPCKHGHLSKRRTKCTICVECSTLYKRKLHDSTRDKIREANKLYYSLNKEKVKLKVKEYAENNKEEVLQRARDYYVNNKESFLASCKEYRKTNKVKIRILEKKYRQNNRGKLNAIGARYRAGIRQASVPWADLDEIREFYEDAQRLKITGVNWHVDHIIPLKHPLICGLHVETNLQLLPDKENLSKNNKFDIHSYVHVLPNTNP